jgi:hypothetical protein
MHSISLGCARTLSSQGMYPRLQQRALTWSTRSGSLAGGAYSGQPGLQALFKRLKGLRGAAIVPAHLGGYHRPCSLLHCPAARLCWAAHGPAWAITPEIQYQRQI